MGLRKFSVMLI